MPRKPVPPEPLVLFQVPNHTGLGHMNRMACVAIALRQLAPLVRSLFIVEGTPHGFFEPLSLAYLTLPYSRDVLERPEWQPWPLEQKEHLLAEIALSIITELGPDLIVYDCLPNPYVAEAAIAKNIKSVLCIRKVKDILGYCANMRVQRVLDSGASILVPHLETDFKLPQTLLSRSTFVGPIVKSMDTGQSKRVGSGKRTIVICAGGGGGGQSTISFFNLALEASRHLREEMHNINVVLITGPLFKEWSKLVVPLDVCMIPFDPEFSLTCALADLVISQAGYNTINELIVLGTPTICIPASRSFDDQLERARSAAATHLNIECFEGDDAITLAHSMARRLRRKIGRAHLDVPRGATRAAIHIMREMGYCSSAPSDVRAEPLI